MVVDGSSAGPSKGRLAALELAGYAPIIPAGAS